MKCDGIVEKRLDVSSNEMELNTKPLFDSDDENEENGIEKSVLKSKREGSEMVEETSMNSKKMKNVYDAALYLEAIEKASSEEAKLLEKTNAPTRYVMRELNDD